MRVSFVTLACYDWRLLPASIAAYYDVADEILIGLDFHRVTWSGTPFECDRAALANALSPFPKCRVVEGAFSLGLVPLENDCAEREYLAQQARNEWVVEVDADEIVDGAAIVSALDHCPPDRQLYGYWRDILKICGQTALVRDTSSGGKLCALATRSRKRRYARQTPQTPPYVVDIEVEHLTTARPESELIEKIAGWGHSDTIRPDFIDYWRGLSPGSPGTISVPVTSLRWSKYLAV